MSAIEINEQYEKIKQLNRGLNNGCKYMVEQSEFICKISTENATLRSALDNACGFIAQDRPPITKSKWKKYFILVATEELKLAKEDK